MGKVIRVENKVYRYLKYLKVPVSKRYCEFLIQSHPDYPSFLSIADVLNRLGIRLYAGRVKKEESHEIQCPFLIQPDLDKTDLVFIKKQEELNSLNDKQDYQEAYILRAESTDSVLDSENNKYYIEENLTRATLAIGCLTIFLAVAIPSIISFNLASFALLVCTALGCIVGYLLISKDLGIEYESVESFCNTGEKTNCDKVLNSDMAKIFGFVTLSDLVVAYFIFQLFVLSFSLSWLESTNSVLQILTLLSWITIPVVFFSIVYQGLYANAWCKLCLVVDGILVVQFSIFTSLFISNSIGFAAIELTTLVLLVFIFIAVSTTELMIKVQIERILSLNRTLAGAYHIKHSPEVFSYLLSGVEENNYSQPFSDELILGDKNTPLQIIMASNLYCDACKEEHNQIDELLNIYPNELHFVVRFIRDNAYLSRDTRTIQYLLSYWKQNECLSNKKTPTTQLILHEWYELMDFEKFVQKYPLENKKLAAWGSRLAKYHFDWQSQIKVVRTPTFFINGKQIVKSYSLNDIKAMVPGILFEIEKSGSQSNKIAI